MKKLLYYTQFYAVLLIFWIALFERVDFQIILIGLVFSIITIYYVEKILLKMSFFESSEMNIPKLAIYFVVLLFEIFISSLKTIPQILSLNVNPDIVEITTEIKNTSKKCILANSITLTPGTVTIDIDENKLKVLWLNCESKDSAIAGDLIKGTLEKHLL